MKSLGRSRTACASTESILAAVGREHVPQRASVVPAAVEAERPAPTLSAFLFDGDRRVPKGPLPSIDPTGGWRKKPRTGLRATWLGHSTVLLEIDGVRVLTDPVWGPRASPSRWAGPKRFQPVPVPCVRSRSSTWS